MTDKDTMTDTEPEKGTPPRSQSPPAAATTTAPHHSKDDPFTAANAGVDDASVVYPKGIKLFLIIASLCLTIFLVALDQTIIAPALGAITGEFASVGDIG